MIYTTIKLINGDTITVNRLTGLEWFNASLKSEAPGVTPMYLICESCMKKGKMVDMEYLKGLDIEDLMSLCDIMNNQFMKINGL